MPAVGKKRSVRDRLGGNAENSMLHGSLFNDNSKRFVLLYFEFYQLWGSYSYY